MCDCIFLISHDDLHRSHLHAGASLEQFGFHHSLRALFFERGQVRQLLADGDGIVE